MIIDDDGNTILFVEDEPITEEPTVVPNPTTTPEPTEIPTNAPDGGKTANGAVSYGKTAANTGDSENPVLWLAMMAAAAGGIAASVRRRKVSGKR